jgi:hypothetical protein
MFRSFAEKNRCCHKIDFMEQKSSVEKTRKSNGIRGKGMREDLFVFEKPGKMSKKFKEKLRLWTFPY